MTPAEKRVGEAIARFVKFALGGGGLAFQYAPPLIFLLFLIGLVVEGSFNSQEFARIVTLVALTLTSLTAWRLSSFLYYNRARDLLEQLRLFHFLNRPQEHHMLTKYLVVHTLLESGLYVEDDLLGICEMLSVSETSIHAESGAGEPSPAVAEFST